MNQESTEKIDDILSLTSQVTQDALIHWSDQKKKEFSKTFEDRSKVAQFLLISTGKRILIQAEKKHFISSKHTNKVNTFHAELQSLADSSPSAQYGNYELGGSAKIGGRTVAELAVIAQTRADRLSPLNNVNLMLIVDKIQNRKDFEKYHLGSHERSGELAKYYRSWLERLGVTEDKYEEYVYLLDAYYATERAPVSKSVV